MKQRYSLLLGAGLLALAPLASAEFYIGAGLYDVSVDENIENVNFDDSSTTGALFLGWRPIELIGAEVGYYDFGELEADDNTTIEGGALTVAGLLSFELGPVGLYGKAGLASTDVDIKNGSFSDDDSSSDPFGGLGATVDIMDKLYVYAEYLRFDNDAKLDAVGAGIRISF
ncbi:outer membrane beta-barrel protein [Alcanivorax sp. S6407]|uniref:outer membrane beta-barrel protein n=1 Tax=Alcanivorax sp. S6407 TaxID=2926424 RepID=UPI001FF5DBA3|nr:outer membrane beta-barrel protein [Alcanivorax sp. S6407]MCK0152881.1 outer membrane beta-barrel protein [Alcanivorax sp. S6407]